VTAERTAARVFTRWIDDPTECPFAFDVIVDPGAGRICGEWPIFGAADLDAAQPQPFVLLPSGRLAFGSEDRHWRTDFRACAMQVHARFTIWWTEDDPATYEVVKIAALGGKDARLRRQRP
jgi:hypothetical protein